MSGSSPRPSPPVIEVSGFSFGSTTAGLKKSGAPDLGLILSEEDATVAGVFTRNLVKAAPVVISQERIGIGRARAVLVNSGNANACTGRPGHEAALNTTQALAEALRIPPSTVLPASTGVIGEVLPEQTVTDALRALIASLSPKGSPGFAEAIRTTDRFPKVATAKMGPATVLGIGKGAGMFGPDLAGTESAPFDRHATMLAFLLTDAKVDAQLLRDALQTATHQTFNEHTVDGDTSTNDSVYALASGQSGTSPTKQALTEGLTTVCDALAAMMVMDGEGANHAVTIRVSGLQDDDAAKRVARTVAASPLVKTMFFGEDPNWGRLLAAAGRAGVAFAPSEARIRIGDVEIVTDGLAVGTAAEARAGALMKVAQYEVALCLGRGPGRARVVTSDLGHGYIDVNAGYRS